MHTHTHTEYNHLLPVSLVGLCISRHLNSLIAGALSLIALIAGALCFSSLVGSASSCADSRCISATISRLDCEVCGVCEVFLTGLLSWAS